MEHITRWMSNLPTEMQIATWLWLLSYGIITYVVTRCIYNLYFHPASKFPGPKLAAISNIWYAYHWLTGRWPWKMEQIIKKYGTVVRIAPNELVFSTPQAITDIYGSAVKNHETFVKTSFSDFDVGDGGITWEQDPARHRQVSKRLSPVFSTKSIRAKEHVLHMYIDLFVEKMRELGSSRDGVELPKWVNWLAMDISADMTYGREIHHLRDGKSSDFLDAINDTNLFGTVSQIMQKFPLLGPLKFLFVPPRILRTLPHVLKINSDEVDRRIEQRANTKHLDYFESLVPPDSAVPSGKERTHLEQVAAQLLVAGYDPVADQFYGLMFFLLKEPEILAILVEEIRGAFASYSEITPDALVSLRYLHACIQETFRMFDTGPNGLPRISPGAVVDGVYIPKGVECQMSFFTALRSKQYFQDPLHYRPQRWLSPDHPKYEAQYSGDALKSVTPFSTGPRSCPGRESAWIQIRLYLAKVLWTFDLELVRGHSMTFDKDFSVYTMWNKPAIWVRFVPVARE
ncbi:isotrichodermin C-15 hydroxylase [Xylaria cf. heliscus]|nr:isotrichodermin C-15 hydroxylase [Xylaria cf. heliscus]